MSELEKLSDKIDNLERRQDSRYDQQLRFNESMVKAVNNIEKAITRFDVFQAEMNHTNAQLAAVRTDVAENTRKTAAIERTIASEQTIIKELQGWKKAISGGVILLILAALASKLIPDSQTEAVKQQTRAVQALVEQLKKEGNP